MLPLLIAVQSELRNERFHVGHLFREALYDLKLVMGPADQKNASNPKKRNMMSWSIDLGHFLIS